MPHDINIYTYSQHGRLLFWRELHVKKSMEGNTKLEALGLPGSRHDGLEGFLRVQLLVHNKHSNSQHSSLLNLPRTARSTWPFFLDSMDFEIKNLAFLAVANFEVSFLETSSRNRIGFGGNE